jgi:hypothetical protein
METQAGEGSAKADKGKAVQLEDDVDMSDFEDDDDVELDERVGALSKLKVSLTFIGLLSTRTPTGYALFEDEDWWAQLGGTPWSGGFNRTTAEEGKRVYNYMKYMSRVKTKDKLRALTSVDDEHVVERTYCVEWYASRVAIVMNTMVDRVLWEEGKHPSQIMEVENGKTFPSWTREWDCMIHEVTSVLFSEHFYIGERVHVRMRPWLGRFMAAQGSRLQKCHVRASKSESTYNVALGVANAAMAGASLFILCTIWTNEDVPKMSSLRRHSPRSSSTMH